MYILSRTFRKALVSEPTILYYTGINSISDSFFRPGMSEEKKDAIKFNSYEDAKIRKKEIESLIQFQRGFELKIEKI